MGYIIRNITGKGTQRQNIILIYNDGIKDQKITLKPRHEIALDIPEIPAKIKRYEISGLIEIQYLKSNDFENRVSLENKKNTSIKTEPTKKQQQNTKKEVNEIKKIDVEEPINDGIDIDKMKLSDLKEFCEEKMFPIDEWDNLKKDDLKDYIKTKIS